MSETIDKLEILNTIKTIQIGRGIALFLLNTNRATTAIELCKECIFLLDSKAPEKVLVFPERERALYQVTHMITYFTLSKMYDLVGDHTSGMAIRCSKKLMLLENKVCVNYAACLESEGEYEQAKGLYEEALYIAKKTCDRQQEALCYRSLGTVFTSLGEYTRAEEYLHKALAVSKEIGDSQGEILCYLTLGRVFDFREEFVKAEETYEKALSKMYDLIGDHTSGMAIACRKTLMVLQSKVLVHYAAFLVGQGKYDQAKGLYKKALDIVIMTGDRQKKALCCTGLGTVFTSLGEYTRAEEYLHKALAVSKEIGDTQSEALCYFKLGGVFGFREEYVKAKGNYEKALAIIKGSGDRRREALCYGYLGVVFRRLGEYFKAEEYLQRALEMNEEVNDKRQESSLYANLGAVFSSLGKNDKAKECFKKAIETRKEMGDRLGEASDCRNLGTVFGETGEYGMAEEYFQKALAIAKEIGVRELEAYCYLNLGYVFQSVEEHTKAEEYYQKSLTICKEVGERNGEASCYANLGVVFECLGKYANSEEYLQKSLALKKEIGDKQGEAKTYGNLGILFHSLGEYAKAEEFLQKALALFKEIGHMQGEAVCFGSLGEVLKSQGQRTKAEQYHRKALALAEEIGDLMIAFRQQLDLARVLMSEGKTQEALTNLLSSIHNCEKMRSFLTDNDQFKISFSDLQALPYDVLTALFCETGNPTKGLYAVELGRARALVDLMSAQYSVAEQISVDPQSWAGIEEIIKKESTCSCLYIFFFQRYIFLWVLTANKEIHFRRIDFTEAFGSKGKLKDVDAFFGKEPFRKFHISLPEHCEDRSLFPSGTSHSTRHSQESSHEAVRLVEEDEEEDQEIQPSLALYYKLIIAPVADLLDEPEIIIVPERNLYKVPFAALKDESGKYLSETFKIRIVPSLTTLKLIQDRPVVGNESEANPLIVGDPDVSQVFFLTQLPGARKEAEMIGGLLGVQPLLGQEASKHAVLEMMHSASLIHFAAHGDAERGEIALAPVRPSRRILKRDDYLLTMPDVAQVQLRAKLVVLSCCHSGRGQIRAEGVVGIARAFLGSGARSVLVALWAIQDKATEQFMSRFYEHLVRGESASESLHQAMNWMRGNGFSDVREWAPFMLIGDNVTLDFRK